MERNLINLQLAPLQKYLWLFLKWLSLGVVVLNSGSYSYGSNKLLMKSVRLDSILRISESNLPLLEDTITVKKLNDLIVIANAKPIIHKADKINVKLNLDGLPSTVKLDIALKRVAGISVTDEGVKLLGSPKSAKLYLDNSEISIDELSKIDADQIKKLEIKRISLDNETYFGEINIVTKKNKQNLIKGELELGANLLNLGGSITPVFKYQTNKLDIVSWGSYKNYQQKGYIEIQRNDIKVLDATNSINLNQYSFSFRTSLYPSPKLNIMTSHFLFGYKNPIKRSVGLKNQTIQSKEIKESVQNNLTNLVLKYKINDRIDVILKSRYFVYNTSNQNSNPKVLFNAKMNELSSELEFNLHNTNVFNLQYNGDYGLKYINRKHLLNNANDLYLSQIIQLYLTNQFLFNNNLSCYFVLKGESDYSLFKHNTLRNLCFLPSLSLNYSLGNQNFNLLYNRRIERPSIDYLNPDIFYINEFQKTKGNIGLSPQYSNFFSFNHSFSFRGAYMGYQLGYESTKDLITPIYMDNNELATYENALMSESLNANVYYNKSFISNHLNLNLMLGYSYRFYNFNKKTESQSLINLNNNWLFNSYLNVSYLTSKNWFFNFTMAYQNKDLSITSITYKRPTLDFMISKSFLKERLEVSLNYMDMFRIGERQYVEYNFKNMKQTAFVKHPSSMLLLSLTYKFGSKLKRREQVSEISNDDIYTKGK